MEQKCKYQDKCVQFKSWCVNHICNDGICGSYKLATACGKDVNNKDYCLFQMVYDELDSAKDRLYKYEQCIDIIEKFCKTKHEKCHKTLAGTKDYCHCGCYQHNYCIEHNIQHIINNMKEDLK